MFSRIVTVGLFMLYQVDACLPTKITVSKAADAANELVPTAFGVQEVQDHMQYLLDLNITDYRQDGTTTLACVDARGDDAYVATPGGDLAEFASAAYLYFNLTGNANPTQDNVRSLFRGFVSKYISPSRPFYFHTDDTKLKSAFVNISNAVDRTISIIPVNGPPAAEADIWLDYLSKGSFQGCGHIRLMINTPEAYGMTSEFVPRAVIKAFFQEMWAASPSNKTLYQFVVKLGPLAGNAIAIVSNIGPSCSGQTPAVKPNFNGNSLFVYNADSATSFRKTVLTPFFTGQSGANLNGDVFANALEQLHGTQLGATLTMLSPANSVDIFVVQVNTTASASTTTPKSAISIGSSSQMFALLALAVFYTVGIF